MYIVISKPKRISQAWGVVHCMVKSPLLGAKVLRCRSTTTVTPHRALVARRLLARYRFAASAKP
jgi:hypothetical protein